MSLSIGTASLKLVANADKLSAGLDAAYVRISGFKAKAQQAVQNLSPSSLLSFLPLGGQLAGAFNVATLGANLFSDAVGRTRQLADVGKQAKTLGIAADQYMGLSAAAATAGLQQDQFAGLLQKSSAKIAGGSADAAAALKMIGLNISDLKGMSPDQQFYAVADGLKGVEDAGTKAFVAQKLYEEQGLKLLPVLGKGSEKLKEFVEQQKKMGTALSDKDMASVERAKAAIPKIQATFDGLFNRVVVAMAPLIETVGNTFGKIVGKLSPVFDWIGRAAETYFGLIGPIVEEVIDVVADGFAWVADLFGGIFGFAGQMPSIGDVITGVFKGVGKALAYVVDTVKALGGGIAIVASFAVGAFGEIVHAIGSLIAIAAELPDTLGGDMFKDAADAVKKFGTDSTATAKGMRDWGLRQVDGFGSTAKQVDAWFDKLKAKKKEAAADGLGGVFAGAGDSAAAKPMKTLLGGALEQGSKEEFSIRAKWESDGKLLQSEQAKANVLLAQIKGGIDGVKTAIAAIPGIPEI
jgi:hypothetical protein